MNISSAVCANRLTTLSERRTAGSFVISLYSLRCRPLYNTQEISKQSIGYMQCANISTMNNRRPGPVTRIIIYFCGNTPAYHSHVSSQTYRLSSSRIRFPDFFTCVLPTGLSLKPSCSGLLLCLPVSLSLYVSPQKDSNNYRTA
jgi:hypothetical protein